MRQLWRSDWVWWGCACWVTYWVHLYTGTSWRAWPPWAIRLPPALPASVTVPLSLSSLFLKVSHDAHFFHSPLIPRSCWISLPLDLFSMMVNLEYLTVKAQQLFFLDLNLFIWKLIVTDIIYMKSSRYSSRSCSWWGFLSLQASFWSFFLIWNET